MTTYFNTNIFLMLWSLNISIIVSSKNLMVLPVITITLLRFKITTVLILPMDHQSIQLMHLTNTIWTQLLTLTVSHQVISNRKTNKIMSIMFITTTNPSQTWEHKSTESGRDHSIISITWIMEEEPLLINRIASFMS